MSSKKKVALKDINYSIKWLNKKVLLKVSVESTRQFFSIEFEEGLYVISKWGRLPNDVPEIVFDFAATVMQLSEELIGSSVSIPVSYVNPSEPKVLEPGPHTLVIEFTTNDGQYHVDAYYEIKVKLIAP